MLGDGFMIMPTDDVVCAPADGKVTMIFPTLHAFGMKMNNSQEYIGSYWNYYCRAEW